MRVKWWARPQISSNSCFTNMPEILLRISLSIFNYAWCPRGRRTGHEFLWPRELGVEWSEICIATYVSQKYQLATALAMLQIVLPATSEARQVEQKDIFFVKAVRRSRERHQMSYPKNIQKLWQSRRRPQTEPIVANLWWTYFWSRKSFPREPMYLGYIYT